MNRWAAFGYRFCLLLMAYVIAVAVLGHGEEYHRYIALVAFVVGETCLFEELGDANGSRR